MRKSAWVIGAGLLFSSCRQKPAPKSSFDPSTYTYLTRAGTDTLDPDWSYDTASGMVILNIYEPLFTFHGSSTQKLDPLIATEVPSLQNGLISKDGRVYTIPIRQGVRFQDGTPMTPEDVRYSILRFMLTDRDGGPSVLLLEPLLGESQTRDLNGKIKPGIYAKAAKAVQVRGSKLILTLPKPSAPLLAILATWAPILSEKWAASHGAWDGREKTWALFNNPKKQDSPFFEHANGTGPFSLERWDRKNHEIVLKRNEFYWRKPAQLKRVIIRGIDEFETRKLLLEAGDADSIRAGKDQLPQLQNIPGIAISDKLIIGTNPSAFFTFHISTAANSFIGSGRLDGNGIPADFFSHKNIRKAFAYSFDFQGYIRDLENGTGVQPNGCIPTGLLGHNPNQKKYELNLKKATAYFKKALGGQVWEKGFRFTLPYQSGSTAAEAVAHIFKHNIESLNPKFQIDTRPIDWPGLLDAMNSSKLPIFIIGWVADYPDPDDFAFPLMDSRGVYGSVQGYKSSRADYLIEKAASAIDPKKREELYRQVQAIEYDDVPHLLIVEPSELRVQRSWVHGWVYNAIFPDSPYGSYFYPIYKKCPLLKRKASRPND